MRCKFVLAILLIAVFSAIAVTGPSQAAVFSVTTTSDSDCSDFDCDLQSSLTAAQGNSEDNTINVAAGTYDVSSGTLTYASSEAFDLEIRGAHADTTILDGNFANRIMDITLTADGSITIRDLTFQNAINIGLYGFAYTGVTIEDSKFINNTQDFDGIFVLDSGGAAFIGAERVTLKNNLFQGNNGGDNPGGVRIQGGLVKNLKIDDNVFVDNFGSYGAIEIRQVRSAKIVLTNNIIAGNTCSAAFGCIAGASIRVFGSAGFGSTVTLTNNTIVKNKAFKELSIGGVAVGASGGVENIINIYNNIAWGNEDSTYPPRVTDMAIADDENFNNVGATVNLFNNNYSNFYTPPNLTQCVESSSCVSKVNAGGNLNNLDPLFVDVSGADPTTWDLHIQSNSQMKNGGNNSAPELPSTDFEGDARVIGSTVDIGADEFDFPQVSAFVTRFYQQCLNRAPDPAGLAYWVDALLDGSLTGADVAWGFVFSQEFLDLNTTDDEYLTVLYEAFFDRSPDPGGYNYWLSQLNSGMSREDVLDGFIYAQEFIDLCDSYGIIAFRNNPRLVEAFVTRFYDQCLNRLPDPAGLGYWVDSLLNGLLTGADVAYGFVFSQEFLDLNTTNEDYLTVLYRAFFDRQPDPGGFAYWLDQFVNGASREDVLDGFIYAQEFVDLCGVYGITPF